MLFESSYITVRRKTYTHAVEQIIVVSYMNELVRVSGKYQVVIPKSIREKIGLEKGDELTVSLEGNTIVLRVRPESFSEYTLGLHREVWKGTDASEYVEKERSSWKTHQQQ